MNPARFFPSRRGRRAVALVIVLAFVALLTGLVVAFFSSSLLYRQISNSSASQTKVDLFAQGAVETIIGDFKQEIAAGSNAVFYTDTNTNVVARVYLPANPYTAVPALALKGAQSSVTSFAPNLVKRSAYQQSFFPVSPDASYVNYTGGTKLIVPLPLAATATSSSAAPATSSNRAANVASTARSQNGRFISAARWNKSLLLPRAAANQTSDTDLTPDPTQFVAPDWVQVDRNGANPTAVSSAVVGRYAYAIYDEGGLLDANVAGYPLNGSAPYTSANSDAVSSTRKEVLSFADLTQLPGISSLTPSRQQAVINALVGWRNFASAQASGSLLNGYAFAAPSSTPWPYSLAMLGNPSGFMRTGNVGLVNGQSDRKFSSRQELMSLLLTGIATQGPSGQSDRANLQNALQCLGTFSRDVLQPSYAPPSGRPTVLSIGKGGNNASPDAPGVTTPLDDQINPSFLKVRVPTTKTAGRSDGTDLVQGDPLVGKRFNLNRLAWVTWEGPSFQASSATKTALLNAGIPQAMIDAGTAANIQAYFGLTWSSGLWKYNVHNGGGAAGRGSIMRVGRPLNVTMPDATAYVQDAGREPDFFELLKAAISVGSLGKAITTDNGTAVAPNGYASSQVPTNYRYSRDTSIDYQVIQIGANIIDQFDADSLSTRIVFDDGSLPAQEFDGVENLPYLSNFINGMLRVEAPHDPPTNFPEGTHQWPAPGTAPIMGSPGAGVVMLVPALWNPHDVSGSLGSPRPTSFRIIADSTDPITAASADASGSTTGYTKIYTSAVAQKSDRAAVFGYNATNTSSQPTDAVYRIDYTQTGRVLNAANTALTFSDSNGMAFREPTFLLRQDGTIGLQSVAYPNGIASIDVNPVASATDAAGTKFEGFVLGAFPLSFEALDSDGTTSKVMYAGVGFVGVGNIPAQPLVYLTYRVQYEYPTGSGKWITYDTKYGRVSNGRMDFNWNLGTRTDVPTIGSAPDGNMPWNWTSAVDPRTARFGLFFGAMSIHYASPTPDPPGGNGGWIDSTKAIALSLRPDNYGGHYFVSLTVGGSNMGSTDDPVADVPFPKFAAGWTESVVNGYFSSVCPDFNPWMMSQNNSSEPFRIRRFATDAQSGSDELVGPQATLSQAIMRIPTGSCGGRWVRLFQ